MIGNNNRRPNTGVTSLAFSQSALKTLEAHGWPGDIRERENRIKRGVIMAEGRHVTAAGMALETDAVSHQRTLKDVPEAAEREVVVSALRRSKWKVAPTAGQLEISRPTFTN